MRTVPDVGSGGPAGSDASTIHRVRRVLAIKPFRRLWGVTYLCSTADWMMLFGLAGLANSIASSYTAKNFAFSSVVLANLLPGLLFAPIGGLLADRFDRRKIMVVADVLRAALLFSVIVFDSPIWIYLSGFAVSSAAIMWIPAKDAAVPNLLRRPIQVETAGQLGLVMTYGISVVTGLGLFSIITGAKTTLHLPSTLFGDHGPLKIVLGVACVLYLTSALTILTRIPELSLRGVHDSPRAKEKSEKDDSPGIRAMFSDAVKFIKSTPLVRGLLIGMTGAFAAGGAVVGSGQTYANSLGAGQSAFGLLVGCVFLGLVVGMGSAPKLARRLPHDRLFGVAIVFAGIALLLVGLSPHLSVSLVAVSLVGACAGIAFLTGITIIGSQIEDSIRGRINAIYQSLLKVVLGGSLALVPLLVGLVAPTKVRGWGGEIIIDGTRPVMIGGALLASLFGIIAYRQMDSRRTEPILTDLRNALRRRPRRVNGLLIAVEGTTVINTANQASRLAEWLRAGTRPVVLAADPALDDQRLVSLVSGASLTGARAQALAAAAVRADIVERDVQPALDAGSVVVMERFVDSPLAHLSAVAGLDTDELEALADWATGRLRPDITVLLDADPGTVAQVKPSNLEDQWRVQHLLTEMAEADPDRYVVVDADGTEEEVGERVRTAVRAMLIGRLSGLAPAEAVLETK
ncbi:bifunctional MFS transporter/dTMP kinase [Amycolatopsis xylanica]|uniref:bifunctional MFS transporter/dTMP kinase n=1 Tax=Amycolatopsis xylanica TaxID=589385 RepID=UPI000B838890|nr:dTMP kinase [Amycolatopsis xylanica]